MQRHRWNMKKIVFTILPIWLMGIVYIIVYLTDKDSFNNFINFLSGAIPTIFTVPLMYSISIKNKIICGLVRGLLGTFIIMFSIANILFLLSFFRSDSTVEVVESILSFLSFLSLMMSVIGALCYMVICWYLTLGAIATFIIVDYLVKEPVREKDMEVGI